MHTKQAGSIGHFAVATEILKQGYAVFTELGDLSKTDLVVVVNDQWCIRLQVKAISSKNGVIHLSTTKSGPNYHFRYSENQVDVFAVYCLVEGYIFYVSSKELLAHSRMMSFRVTDTKNGQVSGTHRVSDYTDFKRVLRDYMPGPQHTEVKI